MVLVLVLVLLGWGWGSGWPPGFHAGLWTGGTDRKGSGFVGVERVDGVGGRLPTTGPGSLGGRPAASGEVTAGWRWEQGRLMCRCRRGGAERRCSSASLRRGTGGRRCDAGWFVELGEGGVRGWWRWGWLWWGRAGAALGRLWAALGQ